MAVDSTPSSVTQQAQPGQPDNASELASQLGELATDSAHYVRAWSALLSSETKLAGISAVRLVLGLLVVPALALIVCLAADALLVTLLQRWISDWSSCIAIVLGLDFGCLFLLLLAIRRWWRNLSLPRSRAALVRLFERVA